MNLLAHYKAGITYLFLQLKIMFFMSCEIISALEKYIKLFEDKGLCRICGKNVTFSEEGIVAICLQLNEVDALPYETVIDVLTGLTNCSLPDFVKLFDFHLQQAKVKAIDTDTHEGNTPEQVKII